MMDLTGQIFTGTMSTMDQTPVTVTVTGISKKRPVVYSIAIKTSPHRSALERSLFGSGERSYSSSITGERLWARIRSGFYKTKDTEVLSCALKHRVRKPKPVPKSDMSDPDAEFWNYISAYGSDEEKERAADYFDVTPSSFEYDYRTAHS